MTREDEIRAGYARGWCYTPLHGKIPYLKAWNKRHGDGRDTLDQCLAWGKLGNVGLLTGTPSGVDIVDADGLDGDGAEWLAQLPATVTAFTGSCRSDGGPKYHLYYLVHPSSTPLKNWVRSSTVSSSGTGARGSQRFIIDGIDFRTTGGQVVAVGGIHPDTGREYVWMPGRSPDEIP
jgi:hypothetical protein